MAQGNTEVETAVVSSDEDQPTLPVRLESPQTSGGRLAGTWIFGLLLSRHHLWLCDAGPKPSRDVLRCHCRCSGHRITGGAACVVRYPTNVGLLADPRHDG